MTSFSIDTENNVFADDVIIGVVPAAAYELVVDIWQVPQGYRANGYFLAYTKRGGAKEVPACRQSEAMLMATLIAPPTPSAILERAKQDRLELARQDAESLLAQLDADYPEREVLTWDQQLIEAEGYPELDTSLLTVLALARGMELSELVSKVLAKSAQYKYMCGAILGARQWVEDSIEAAADEDTLFAIITVPERLAEVLQ